MIVTMMARLLRSAKTADGTLKIATARSCIEMPVSLLGTDIQCLIPHKLLFFVVAMPKINLQSILMRNRGL